MTNIVTRKSIPALLLALTLTACAFAAGSARAMRVVHAATRAKPCA